MEYEVGDFAQGEVYLGRMVETMRRVSPGPTNPFSITALVIGEVSRITGDTNWLKVSEEAAGIVLSSPFAIPAPSCCPWTWEA
jgi:hypothetical protein